MKRSLQLQTGVTLMELLVYMGISSVVILGMMAFLVQTTKTRVSAESQHLAQHSARQALEQMTYSLRNAYDVVVNVDGTRAIIFSDNPDDAIQPIVTVYAIKDGQLVSAQAISVPPDDSSLQPVSGDGVIFTDVQFKKISASLQVTLGTVKNSRSSKIESTIAFRQRIVSL